jgi:hypothetical protein
MEQIKDALADMRAAPWRTLGEVATAASLFFNLWIGLVLGHAMGWR